MAFFRDLIELVTPTTVMNVTQRAKTTTYIQSAALEMHTQFLSYPCSLSYPCNMVFSCEHGLSCKQIVDESAIVDDVGNICKQKKM